MIITKEQYSVPSIRITALKAQVKHDLIDLGLDAGDDLSINGCNLKTHIASSYSWKTKEHDFLTIRIGFQLIKTSGAWENPIRMREPKRGFESSKIAKVLAKYYREKRSQLEQISANVALTQRVEAVVRVIARNTLGIQIQFYKYSDGSRRVNFTLPAGVDAEQLKSIYSSIEHELEVYGPPPRQPG